MSVAIDRLGDRIGELVDVWPEWGWHLARAWRRTGRAALATLRPWLPLADLGQPDDDGAARLGEAIDWAAAASGAPEADVALAGLAGHVLPPNWALAVDEFLTTRQLFVAPDPLLLALVGQDPSRATARVERALSLGSASRLAVDQAYEVAIAAADLSAPLPARVAEALCSIEATDRFLVDEAARFAGRLRLLARSDLDAAWDLAVEAVVETGPDAVHHGLWSVLARSDRARTDAGARRLIKASTLPATSAVLAELHSTVAPDAARAEVALLAESLASRVERGLVDGRRAWPAVFRLLTATAQLGDNRALARLLALGPPGWSVELATWRPLRAAGGALPETRALLERYLASSRPLGLLEEPTPPPWAYLDVEIGRDRFDLQIDPTFPHPSGYSWGDGRP